MSLAVRFEQQNNSVASCVHCLLICLCQCAAFLLDHPCIHHLKFPLDDCMPARLSQDENADLRRQVGESRAQQLERALAAAREQLEDVRRVNAGGWSVCAGRVGRGALQRDGPWASMPMLLA